MQNFYLDSFLEIELEQEVPIPLNNLCVQMCKDSKIFTVDVRGHENREQIIVQKS